MFEPELFRKQNYCREASTCDVVGIFRGPAVIRRPRNCAPLVTPLLTHMLGVFKISQITLKFFHYFLKKYHGIHCLR